MLRFVVRRVLLMIPTLFIISILCFVIIQLPPGDFLDTLMAQLSAQGESVNANALAALREYYGLGEPVYVQYLKWIWGIFQGDFGYSLEWNRPVSQLIWDRLGLTVLLSLATLCITWIIAFPTGIYSAVRRYSPGDYAATFFGFLGLAIPDFLLALVLMYVAFRYVGQSVGGLFSPEFIEAPWSLARGLDLLGHLWIPAVIIGLSHTAGLIRIMRANLLDELHRSTPAATSACPGAAT
jgi:peptide/nickel transport system permease protein